MTDWLWPGAGGIPWAWAIVATTIIVRTVLLPLTVRQIHSMQRLQAHAPEMKAIQQRYKQDRAKQQEELMKFYRRTRSTRRLVLPADPVPDPGLSRALLRAEGLREGGLPEYPGSDLGWLWNLVPDITQPLSSDPLSAVILLILYATSQTASTYFMSSTMDKMQRYLLLALPLIFLFFVINFPAGLMIYWVTTNLWTTGQGLVTRKLRPKPVPRRSAARGRRRAAATRKPKAESEATPAVADRPTATRQEEEEAREAMSDEPLRVETTGETVGEAKWAALRELEQLYPGLDKASVRFQVLTEGERGLLGVGYTPARVVAVVDESAAPEPRDESAQAAQARELVERVADGIGVRCRVDVREDDEAIHVVCGGAELGLLIGKHGQTIDAIQYLANAVARRGGAEGAKDVVVDAAGYRDRRRATLETMAVRAAQRALEDGRAELEPMTSIERKIVHLRLKEFPGVETASEGAEPNRFVVVLAE